MAGIGIGGGGRVGVGEERVVRLRIVLLAGTVLEVAMLVVLVVVFRFAMGVWGAWHAWVLGNGHGGEEGWCRELVDVMEV